MNPEGLQPNDQVPDNQPLNQPTMEPAFQPAQPLEVSAQPVFQQAPVQQQPEVQPAFGPAPQQAQPMQQMQPAVAPTTPGQKPSKKKLIVLLSSIVGGIILILAGLFIFIAATSVSRADYRDAVAQINATSTANSKFNSAMSRVGSDASSTSDATFEDSAKAAKEAIAAVQSENEALGKLKAVKVGEGKDLYASFNEKLKIHLANNADMVTSFEKIRPASVTCRSVNSVTARDAQVAAMKKCAAEFSKISDIPHKDVAAYVESVKKLYVTSAEIYEGAAGITDPYGKQSKEFRALRDKSNEVQTELRKSSREFSDIINKLDKSTGVKEAATALGNYLEAGQK